MEWTRGPIIGKGASASVSLATTSSGDLFAVKSTALSKSTLLQREQKILSCLDSPYIVQYRGFEIIDQSCNLFMEYVAGGSVSGEIKRLGGSLDESVIRLYANGIVKGLDYLHREGISHCDIKSENVLIGKDGVKIADLGCARFVAEGGSVTVSGTPAFMAPEVARGEDQGFPADIWAVGCTLIEMATGSHPWPELKDPVSALYRIGFSGDVPELPSSFSVKAKDFVTKCLKKDPTERWTAKELLQHPFLLDLDSNSDKVDEFSRNSPNCVLDQGVWDWESPEEWEKTPRNLTHMGCSSSSPSSNSPAERIKRLVVDNSDSINWVNNEDWIVVRNNATIEESSTVVSEPNHKQVTVTTESSHSVSPILESSHQQEEIANPIVVDDEDLLFSNSVNSASVAEFDDDNNGFTDLIMYYCKTFSDSSLVEAIFTFRRKLIEIIIFLFNACSCYISNMQSINFCFSVIAVKNLIKLNFYHYSLDHFDSVIWIAYNFLIIFSYSVVE